MKKTAVEKKWILITGFITMCFIGSFYSSFLPASEYQNSTQDQVIQIIDDAQNTLILNKPAQRIISLAPHISEILFYIEQGEKIVGTDIKSDFPDAAKRISKISDANQINLEAIIALQPDLIIAWKSGNNPKQLAKLKALGYPIYFSEPITLDDIGRNILHFGILTGNKTLASEKAAEFRQQLHQLKNKNPIVNKVKVFYQVWDKPVYTINGEHIISEVIQFCGGENIFHDLKTIAPQISTESVIIRNPDLIISGEDKRDAFQEWKKWPSISAVNHDQFLTINSDHIVRPGPRIILGVEQICQKISQIKSGH